MKKKRQIYLNFDLCDDPKRPILWETRHAMFLTVLFLYQTATNVSEYNITALMHEILTGEKYIPPKIEDEKERKKEMATLQEIREEEFESDQMGNTKDGDTPKETVHATQGELQDFLLQTSCSFCFGCFELEYSPSVSQKPC